MEIFDISVLINPSLPVWPGEASVQIKRVSNIESGDNANVSHISLGAHTGTHVDAPLHFFTDGVSLEKIPLDHFIGEVNIVEIKGVKTITADDIKKVIKLEPGSRILFKTSNSKYWIQGESVFQKEFVAVSPDAARYLVDHEVKLVGIDYLSIAPFSDTRPTHEILLGAGIPILEGIDLSKVNAGLYSLFCLPLKLDGVDGAPVRAILTR